MSASSDLQMAVEARLKMPGVLSVDVPVISRRPKELASDIEAALAAHGLCIHVMPPLPQQITDDAPFIFVEIGEIRVRVIEQPALNSLGADAFQLAEEVMVGLQWQPYLALTEAIAARREMEGEDEATAIAWVTAQPENAPLVELDRILENPLRLARRPTEPAADSELRLIDVLVHATYGFQPKSSND